MLLKVKGKHFVAIGAQILEIVEEGSVSYESSYNVIRAFYPVFPYQKSLFSGIYIYSVTVESFSNWISVEDLSIAELDHHDFVAL